MKCGDSFDKSYMLLIFLLNQKCCAAEISLSYRFCLRVISPIFHTLRLPSDNQWSPHLLCRNPCLLVLLDKARVPAPCRARNDRTPALLSSSSLSQTSLPQGAVRKDQEYFSTFSKLPSTSEIAGAIPSSLTSLGLRIFQFLFGPVPRERCRSCLGQTE